MTSVYALSETDRHASFLVESIDHLVRQGHQVEVFAPSYEGCPSHRVRGVPVHRFRYFLRRWENLTHGQGAPNRIRNPIYLIIAFFYIFFGAIAAMRFCRANRFDVVHVNWPFPHGIWGYLVWKLYKIPMVLTFHGAELLLCRKFGFVRPFIRHAAKHAKELICNSGYTAKELAQYTDKPISIIPFGCTVESQLSVKNPSKPVKDVLFVGRLIARKGVDVLIRAVPRIASQLPICVHIVGEGNMKEEWMRLAKRVDPEGRIVFHGFVSNEELAQLYADADVFVLPAIVDDRGDTEGLGVVLVEALSFGTPVVASNVGGISDVIIDNQTGLLVSAADEVVLSEAVLRVLQDKELAHRLTNQGLAHAQDYFDWHRITAMIQAAYERALTCSREITPS
jgi:glycosyltransferase involved in cell wall biosynthesis